MKNSLRDWVWDILGAFNFDRLNVDSFNFSFKILYFYIKTMCHIIYDHIWTYVTQLTCNTIKKFVIIHMSYRGHL